MCDLVGHFRLTTRMPGSLLAGRSERNKMTMLTVDDDNTALWSCVKFDVEEVEIDLVRMS